MINNQVAKLARILGVAEETLADFQDLIGQSTGRTGVLEKVLAENDRVISETLQKMNSGGAAAHVRGVLQKAIFYHEKQFLDFLRGVEGGSEFEKAANLSRSLAKVGRGFFLKKELIGEILRRRKPDNLLKYLGVGSVEDVFNKVDLTEAFSALRFVESNEWMNQTFSRAYSGFGAGDFEERDIEVRVLGPVWQDIAKKFVEKKHHNVSHLKEFGVIFLNPIKMDIPGKFLRDFALLLHYFHEIEFYSQLFKLYLGGPDFAEKFKALLRGDVKEPVVAGSGNAWLIVQRYLVKENPQDPRLFQPRVNPESIHWAKGERDLVGVSERSGGRVRLAGAEAKRADLSLWFNLDWVGGLFAGENNGEEVVSFDLEDNAMSLVSFMEGKREFFTYHQREAMWTKIFAEYAGGENKLEELIVENFDRGYIIL